MNHRNALIPILSTLALLGAACGGDDDASPAEPTEQTDDAGDDSATADDAATGDGNDSAAEPTEEPQPTEPAEEPTAAPTPEPAPVQILVTNDDGVASAGIDLVVQALLALDSVEVTVVAPAENQSGTSNRVSVPAPTTAEETTTASGYPALAVAGTPADSVNYALDNVFAEPPDLLISGSNDGQNIGPFAELSGTVGAARTGAVRGVPAFAISQGGVTMEAEHASGIVFLVEWLESNLESFVAFEGEVAPVLSLNTPSCAGAGGVRGLLETELATEFDEGEDPFSPDCTSTREDVDDDATAFLNGYAVLTLIPEELVVAPPPES